MGELTLPKSGTVYLDANSFIYSIERIDPYLAILVSSPSFGVIDERWPMNRRWPR